MKVYSVFLLAAGVALLSTTSPARAQGFLTGTFTADQENHAVTSAATGTAVLEYFDGELSYFITVEGLSGPITGAHFHNAPAGVDGGVVRDITASFDGGTAAGLWSSFDTQALTDELVAELFAGNIYLNIHTAANPAGEIRAQLTATDGVTLTADLTPEQESHDVTSSGRGTAIVQISESGAAFFVTVDGLTGPISAAHFHNAEAGVDGGVVRDISGDFSGGTAIGFWTPGDAQPLSDELLVEALKGNLYLNVHTAAHPAGELRGQLLLTSGWGLQASLDPSQEVGGSTGTGFGTAALTLTVGGLVYDLTVTDLTGPITGAHIHSGATGTDGPVVHPFTEEFDGNSASGIWGFDDEGGLTPELLTALLNGELYLNIHTTANPAGELRGQILRAGATALAASLTPEQETADVTQAAAGTAFITVATDRVDYELTVDGLSGPITG
ncbi:MAG: CHRD domain-containing protein, partial [Rhodothermia bacterium]|nr:CHRD domain-containing protein [Rhodothermia bacterium]